MKQEGGKNELRNTEMNPQSPVRQSLKVHLALGHELAVKDNGGFTKLGKYVIPGESRQPFL